MLEVRAGFRYPAIGNPAEATAPSMIVAAATDAEQDPARLVDEGTPTPVIPRTLPPLRCPAPRCASFPASCAFAR